MKLPEKIDVYFQKYREIITYIFFGGLTTVVSFVSYAIFVRFFNLDIVVGNILSWIISVTFAYITNRIWVFESKEKKPIKIIYEIVSFFSSRLLSGAVETLLMFVFAEKLGLYDLGVKIIANVIVIILNYIFSKLIVFRKKNN